jgi:uncharacterized protein (DUF2267 family)
MTAKGLDVFDKTIQTAHIWLEEINEVIGPDRQLAWKVLSVVLQKLRDRMPVELSAHLSAELPLIIRGVYYDQFTPSRQPTDWNREDFVAEVARGFSEIRPVDPQDAIRAVFMVLSRHIPKGQIAKVQQALPEDLRVMWVTAEERAVAPPNAEKPRRRA